MKNSRFPLIGLLFCLILFSGVGPRPHRVDLHRVQARRAMAADHFGGAAEAFRRLAEMIPWQPQLWETAGHYALANHNPEQAVANFKQAAASGVLSFGGYLGFGDAYEQVGNLYTARQIWQAAEQIFGVSTATRTRIAASHRVEQNYPALIEDLKILVRLDTQTNRADFADLNAEIGFLLAAYQPESAPPYLIQASEANPQAHQAARALSFAIQRSLSAENQPYTLMASGQKLAELGRWDLAASAFENAAALQPNYAEAWAYLGESYQHLPATEGQLARLALEKALALNPQSLAANIFMSLYWQRQANFAQAGRFLQTAAELDPRNPYIWADLGTVTAQNGDLEKALAQYIQAVEISGRSPELTQAVIEFCIRYNYQIDQIALPLARENAARNPTDPAALTSMGQVLIRLGDLKNAERFLVRALQSDDEYAIAHRYLGVTYQLQGDLTAARRHLEQAIAFESNRAAALQAKRLLETLP